MEEKLVWKALIQFEGTPAEFNALAANLREMRVIVQIPEWADIIDPHLAGCERIPARALLREEMMEELIQGMPRKQIKFPMPGIAGGIRTPHLHLGDEVVLLDRERFRTLVGQIAKELAERRVDKIDDYVAVMDPVGRLGSLPLPLP